tara:strand:+ start:474 stop:674 length:201 start_codon:yes stop_codon:yes gene_type:complete
MKLNKHINTNEIDRLLCQANNIAYGLVENRKDPNWVHIMQIKSNVLKVLNELFPEHYTGDEETITN